jgi:phosphohistidine phosphatase
MKILLLLRHAKSSWKDERLGDFDRPLNERGKKAAQAIGRYIRKQKMMPDLVLSSPAVRARETTGIITTTAKLTAEIRYDQRIYEADPLRLVHIISQIEDNFGSVLLVGHNPGIEELLGLLTGASQHMPTGALAKIRLEGADDWSEISQAKAILELTIKPKDITE